MPSISSSQLTRLFRYSLLIGLWCAVSSSPINTWTSGASFTWPGTSHGIAGYHQSTNTIWVIGGYTGYAGYTNKRMSFDIALQQYTYHDDLSTVDALTQDAQCNAVIADIMFFNQFGVVGIYNMSSQMDTYPWPPGAANSHTLPAYAESPCQTSDGERYLFFVGGQGSDGIALAVFQVFDTFTHTWLNSTVLPELPIPRKHHACQVSEDSFLYVFAGMDDADGKLNTTLKIDVGSNTLNNAATSNLQPSWNWIELSARLVTAFDYPRTFAIDDGIGGSVSSPCIYVVGGLDADDQLMADVQVLDPSDDTFSTITSLPDAVFAPAVVFAPAEAAATDARVYVFGGYDGGSLDKVLNLMKHSNAIVPATNHPTDTPTRYPTGYPTGYPSSPTSISPTVYPTSTVAPSNYPSRYPSSNHPSNYPSSYPSTDPSTDPSDFPSNYPSRYPSSNSPSNYPSRDPSSTMLPSVPPFMYDICGLSFDLIVCGVRQLTVTSYITDLHLSTNVKAHVEAALVTNIDTINDDSLQLSIISIESNPATHLYEYATLLELEVCVHQQLDASVLKNELETEASRISIADDIESALDFYLSNTAEFASYDLSFLNVIILNIRANEGVISTSTTSTIVDPNQKQKNKSNSSSNDSGVPAASILYILLSAVCVMCCAMVFLASRLYLRRKLKSSVALATGTALNLASQSVTGHQSMQSIRSLSSAEAALEYDNTDTHQMHGNRNRIPFPVPVPVPVPPPPTSRAMPRSMPIQPLPGRGGRGGGGVHSSIATELKQLHSLDMLAHSIPLPPSNMNLWEDVAGADGVASVAAVAASAEIQMMVAVADTTAPAATDTAADTEEKTADLIFVDSAIATATATATATESIIQHESDSNSSTSSAYVQLEANNHGHQPREEHADNDGNNSRAAESDSSDDDIYGKIQTRL